MHTTWIDSINFTMSMYRNIFTNIYFLYFF